MPGLPATDQQSVRRRLAEVAEDEREERRAFIRTIALLVFWPAVAIAGMAWGFQMNDATLGQSIFYLFVVIGNLGILGTLARASLRGA